METEMTTNHDESAEIRTRWREHLARWAERELRRQGLHMRPDGKIHPLPSKRLFSLATAAARRRPAADLVVSGGCDTRSGPRLGGGDGAAASGQEQI
jgi:hypothetical protein